MALGEWCGKPCSDCETGCGPDARIPCSPDCENLTADGKILVKRCLEDSCEEPKHIFGIPRLQMRNCCRQ